MTGRARPRPRPTLAARWALGDVREYVVHRQRVQQRDGDVSRSESRLRFRVARVAQTPARSLHEWTYATREPVIAPNPLLQAILDISTRLRIHYATSARGTFRRLHGVRALRRQLTAALDAHGGALAPPILAALRATIGGDLLAHYAKDVPLFHGAFAVRGAPGEEQILPTLVQSPLGGPPIDAALRIAWTPQPDRDVVTRERLLDPDAMRTSVLAQLTRLAGQMGRPGPTAADLTRVVMVDRSTHELERETGWPLRIRFEREAYVGTATELGGYGETIEILPVYPLLR